MKTGNEAFSLLYPMSTAILLGEKICHNQQVHGSALKVSGTLLAWSRLPAHL